jgi:hypothetical protein
MMDLNGHEAGNGGHSPGKSKVHRVSPTRQALPEFTRNFRCWALPSRNGPWPDICDVRFAAAMPDRDGSLFCRIIAM